MPGPDARPRCQLAAAVPWKFARGVGRRQVAGGRWQVASGSRASFSSLEAALEMILQALASPQLVLGTLLT